MPDDPRSALDQNTEDDLPDDEVVSEPDVPSGGGDFFGFT